MTLEEYLEKTLEKVNEADTSPEVDQVLRTVENTLLQSKIPTIRIRWFWTELYTNIRSGRGRRILKEAQAQAALNALVAHALSAISALSTKYAK